MMDFYIYGPGENDPDYDDGIRHPRWMLTTKECAGVDVNGGRCRTCDFRCKPEACRDYRHDQYNARERARMDSDPGLPV